MNSGFTKNCFYKKLSYSLKKYSPRKSERFLLSYCSPSLQSHQFISLLSLKQNLIKMSYVQYWIFQDVDHHFLFLKFPLSFVDCKHNCFQRNCKHNLIGKTQKECKTSQSMKGRQNILKLSPWYIFVKKTPDI